MTKVFVLDTETTGFNIPVVPVSLGYIERIGAPLDYNFGDYEEFYFNPGKPIELGAIATHGVYPKLVSDMPLFSSYKLPEMDFMVGHQVDYDWEALGKPNVRRICTLALSRSIWPDADSHKLAAMYLLLHGVDEHSVRKIKDAHSVATDVEICHKILDKIIEHLEPDSWEELWNISELARIPTKMPFGKHKDEPISQIPRSYKEWLLKQPDVDPYLRKALLGAK